MRPDRSRPDRPGDTAYSLAVRQQFLRLVHSLMLEGILPESSRLEIRGSDRLTIMLTDADAVRCHLYRQDPLSPCEMILHGPAGALPLQDPVTFADGPARLWARRHFGTGFRHANWDRVLLEMTDSFRNECLATRAQRSLFRRIRDASPDTDNFFQLLNAPRWITSLIPPHDRDSLLMQIASFSGHRIYPFAKLRMMGGDGTSSERRSLSPETLLACAPEFAPDLPLRWIAAHKDAMTVSLSRRTSITYRDYVGRHFPSETAHWSEGVHSQGHRPGDFLPVPVHPLQLPVIERRFAAQISRGTILPDCGASGLMRPTVSMRTMMKVRTPEAPQIKTTINMQMTSVVRTINPARAFNAPILSDLLLDVLEEAPDIARALRIASEPVSVLWGRITDHSAAVLRDGYQLDAVFRTSPESLTETEELRIPLNALFTSSPVSRNRILIDVMQAAGVDGSETAQSWCREYMDVVLTGSLRLLTAYGISIEGHQQNIDMVFGPDGRPHAAVYRDINGGLEIYEPLLSASGMRLSGQLHPVRRGILQSLDLPVTQILHCIFVSHLMPFIWLVAQAFGCPERDLLSMLRERVASLLDEAPARFTGKGPEARAILNAALTDIRQALLKRPWRSKCMLGMRIMQTQDVSFTDLPNPLVHAGG